MRFVRKNFNITDAPKKELWIGEMDSSENFNSIALVDVRDEEHPNKLYFGEVRNNYFNGLGAMYYADSVKDTFVGRFVGGQEELGFRFSGNNFVLKDFKDNKENIFVLKERGDWAYIEKSVTQQNGCRRAIRYLKDKDSLEFTEFKSDDLLEVFNENNRAKAIDFKGALGGSTVYQNLYGCSFERLSYNSITSRLDDFVEGQGTLNSGETWEDFAQKMNNESHGLGVIRWGNGNFYFGEWNDGWRTGFGMYRFKQDGECAFCNYKKNETAGDVKIEYSANFNQFVINFLDINVHAYLSANKTGNDDSVFGITNDSTKVSFDVFNDFSVCIFKRENDKWNTVASRKFSLTDVIDDSPNSNNNLGGGEKDLFSLFKNKISGFNGNINIDGENSSNNNNTAPVNAEEELNKLVGLRKVKEKVELFKASAKKRRGKVNLNFAFVGNPGTGKTVVARLFAQILNKAGLLPTANLIEVSRADLVGAYIGESEKKTTEIIQRAMGGVLFIDEAYALFGGEGGTHDYGKQVVEILLKTMEDKRGEICIILAGYPEEMRKLFDMNSGFRSRIPEMNYIEFENYTEDELRQIAKGMIEQDPDIDSITDEAFEELMRLIMRQAYKKNFDNARCVRNTITAVIDKQILRTKDDPNDHNIILDDVRSISDPSRNEHYVPAEQRLNELIGLDKVKQQVISLKNTVKKFKNMPDKLNLHMAFFGNPGTGKTEVAKLIAEIFYDEKILPTKNLVEIDPSGLIGQYVGQTAPKTHDVVQRALGGVLFIDEAYVLASGGAKGNNSDFGAEAVEALLKDMEEYRGKFCVILAGYTNEMINLFDLNPGFKSRIPDRNYIKFPDYSADELLEIAKLMVRKDGYTMNDDAFEELKKIINLAKNRKNFENARFVRNTLESIESIQNSRTVDTPSDLTITLEDVVNYEKDLNIFEEEVNNNSGRCISQGELLSLPESNGPVDANFIIERSVSIHTETHSGAGEGTGFFVSPDGYIVTNNHVIEDGVDVTVSVNYVLANGRRLMVDSKAQIIAADKEHDVAVIKIDKEGEEMPYFTLSRPDDPDPALLTNVIMGGYPLGKSRFHQITLTTGKVQSINVDEHLEGSMKRIYLDLSGTHGNSGSAVIDVNRARVIGIFSGASVDRGANAELNFAVPTKYIWDLIIKANENQ